MLLFLKNNYSFSFRNAISVPDLQGEAKDDASNREGRFAWYYMTTTLTSVSTSTSTSTTYSCKCNLFNYIP